MPDAIAIAAAAQARFGAALGVQKLVRGWLGRKQALRRLNEVYEKIFDPHTHGHYYYNTVTDASSWEAAVLVQAAWRRRLAKRLARSLVAASVSMVLDEASGCYYYYNVITGEASWSKPALLGSEELEPYQRLLLTAGGADSYTYPLANEASSLDNEAALSLPSWQQPAWADAALHDMDGDNGEEMYTYPRRGERQRWRRAPPRRGQRSAAQARVDAAEREALSAVAAAAAAAAAAAGDASTAAPAAAAAAAAAGDVSTAAPAAAASGAASAAAAGVAAAATSTNAGTPQLQSTPPSGSAVTLGAVAAGAQGAGGNDAAELDWERPEGPLEGGVAALDLSGLGVTRITSRMYDLRGLRALVLANNALERISPDICDLASLTHLDISNNRVQKLPNELGLLRKLTWLSLSNNRISSFSGHLYLAKALQWLDLSGNQLERMPLQTGNLELLKATREWDVGVGQLKDLTALNLTCNALLEWPLQLELCTKLAELRMGRNALSAISRTVAAHAALRVLCLECNQLIDLPRALALLPSLEHLDVSGNPLGPALPLFSSVNLGPRKAASKTTFFSSLHVLKATDCGLTMFPAEGIATIGNGWHELDLSGNSMGDVQLPQLLALRTLRLARCGLSRAPDGLAQSHRLECIDLSDNALVDLPRAAFGALFRLSELNVSGNKLQALAPYIGALVSLHNQLKALPANARWGTFTALPSPARHWRCVRYLDFTALPSAARHWQRVRYLDMSRNPLPMPPATHTYKECLQQAHAGQRALIKGDLEHAIPLLAAAAQRYCAASAVEGMYIQEDQQRRATPATRAAVTPATRAAVMRDQDPSHHRLLAGALLLRSSRAHAAAAKLLVPPLPTSTPGHGSSAAAAAAAAAASSGGKRTAAAAPPPSALQQQGRQQQQRQQRQQRSLDPADLSTEDMTRYMTLRQQAHSDGAAAVAAALAAERVALEPRPLHVPTDLLFSQARALLASGSPAEALQVLSRVPLPVTKGTPEAGVTEGRLLRLCARNALGQYDRAALDARRLLGHLEMKAEVPWDERGYKQAVKALRRIQAVHDEVQVLLAQAEEGNALLLQMLDTADTARGFEVTRYGAAVRNRAQVSGLVLAGNSRVSAQRTAAENAAREKAEARRAEEILSQDVFTAAARRREAAERLRSRCDGSQHRIDAKAAALAAAEELHKKHRIDAKAAALAAAEELHKKELRDAEAAAQLQLEQQPKKDCAPSGLEGYGQRPRQCSSAAAEAVAAIPKLNSLPEQEQKETDEQPRQQQQQNATAAPDTSACDKVDGALAASHDGSTANGDVPQRTKRQKKQAKSASTRSASAVAPDQLQAVPPGVAAPDQQQQQQQQQQEQQEKQQSVQEGVPQRKWTPHAVRFSSPVAAKASAAQPAAPPGLRHRSSTANGGDGDTAAGGSSCSAHGGGDKGVGPIAKGGTKGGAGCGGSGAAAALLLRRTAVVVAAVAAIAAAYAAVTPVWRWGSMHNAGSGSGGRRSSSSGSSSSGGGSSAWRPCTTALPGSTQGTRCRSLALTPAGASVPAATAAAAAGVIGEAPEQLELEVSAGDGDAPPVVTLHALQRSASTADSHSSSSSSSSSGKRAPDLFVDVDAGALRLWLRAPRLLSTDVKAADTQQARRQSLQLLGLCGGEHTLRVLSVGMDGGAVVAAAALNFTLAHGGRGGYTCSDGSDRSLESALGGLLASPTSSSSLCRVCPEDLRPWRRRRRRRALQLSVLVQTAADGTVELPLVLHQGESIAAAAAAFVRRQLHLPLPPASTAMHPTALPAIIIESGHVRREPPAGLVDPPDGAQEGGGDEGKLAQGRAAAVWVADRLELELGAAAVRRAARREQGAKKPR
ncbi:hypothetical protein JKP88DRAFT_311942 [Tribonema minus]|uniref:WW domain-containing protein n=1 Tax=Tribonema minus TaxID=303371 RepID=A0A835Z3H8_9STRA|nr:hypothetical protein JKP88DRAFT_311942 [Tribonema minus]